MSGMKFIVESKEHSEQIQKALFRLGYYWHGGSTASSMVEVQERDAPYLFADYEKKCITYGHGRQHFDYHHYPEYVYRLGMVEPRNGRQVQSVPPPVLDSEDPTDMHAHAPDPKPYINAKDLVGTGPLPDRIDARGLKIDGNVIVNGLPSREQVQAKLLDFAQKFNDQRPPPVGCRPRHLAEEAYLRERRGELMAATYRYVTAQKDVPWQWVAEYNELDDKIRNIENSLDNTKQAA